MCMRRKSSLFRVTIPRLLGRLFCKTLLFETHFFFCMPPFLSNQTFVEDLGKLAEDPCRRSLCNCRMEEGPRASQLSFCWMNRIQVCWHGRAWCFIDVSIEWAAFFPSIIDCVLLVVGTVVLLTASYFVKGSVNMGQGVCSRFLPSTERNMY